MPKVNASEALVAMDYALGYELMRETLREQARSMPRGLLANLLGVSRSTLSRFMNGGDAGPKLWAAGASFADGMADPPEVELEAVALNLIADTFPPRERARVRRALADAIRGALAAEGRTPSSI